MGVEGGRCRKRTLGDRLVALLMSAKKERREERDQCQAAAAGCVAVISAIAVIKGSLRAQRYFKNLSVSGPIEIFKFQPFLNF